MTHVAICIPARDQVHTSFSYALTNMACEWSVQNVPKGHALALYHSKGTLIANQRQDLARVAMEGGASHILWLDSDMKFPKNTLERLLAHDLPIVAASYATRRIPVRTVAFENDQDWTCVYTEDGSTGLQEVASVGMGCMLVKTEVYASMPKPWFAIGYSASADCFIGEDIYFCRKARTLGYKVMIDHDLSKEVRHIGEMEYCHEQAIMERDAELEVT